MRRFILGNEFTQQIIIEVEDSWDVDFYEGRVTIFDEDHKLIAGFNGYNEIRREDYRYLRKKQQLKANAPVAECDDMYEDVWEVVGDNEFDNE